MAEQFNVKINRAFRYHFENPNYFFLLISLFALIALPPLAALFEYGTLFVRLNLALIILLAAVYVTSNKKELVIFLGLGLILLTLTLLQEVVDTIQIIYPLFGLIYFSLVFWKILQGILFAKEINLNTIFACISGYMVLGLVAAPFFHLISISFPEAFHMPKQEANLYDFIYYGYVVITTVGFGDITPIHPIAKSFTIVLGIASQLYLTILAAILIGKFLAADVIQKEEEILKARSSDEEKSSIST